ncbi:hypothetical protein Emed_007586 [Eimeria media]
MMTGSKPTTALSHEDYISMLHHIHQAIFECKSQAPNAEETWPEQQQQQQQSQRQQPLQQQADAAPEQQPSRLQNLNLCTLYFRRSESQLKALGCKLVQIRVKALAA